jgi:hypothetical protein
MARNIQVDLPSPVVAVHGQAYPHLELIAADNVLKVVSLSMVKENVPWVSQVRTDKDQGFGAAHDRAIEAACGGSSLAPSPEFVMKPEQLSSLIEALRGKPDCGSHTSSEWLPGDAARRQFIDGSCRCPARRYSCSRQWDFASATRALHALRSGCARTARSCREGPRQKELARPYTNRTILRNGLASPAIPTRTGGVKVATRIYWKPLERSNLSKEPGPK